MPEIIVTALEHRGSYMQIDKTYDALMGALAERGLLTPEVLAGMRMVAVFPDDPDATPEAELRSYAGIVTPELLVAEPPLRHMRLAGGKYAVLRHRGPYADMKAAYHWFYGQWLPQSGYDAADAPGYEEYLNNPRETAPADLLSDIHLPLA
jgi:AraC family transcriptional regulator